MSNPENLTNALKRANTLNLKLRIRNKHLKEKIQELEMKIKLQKIYCKFFHRQGKKFTVWITEYWLRVIYYLEDKKNDTKQKNYE